MALNNEDLFLVNQGGDTKKIKYETLLTYLNENLDHPITIGSTEPTDPENGDLWVDTSECPPELKLYRGCDGEGWIGIEGTPKGVIDTPSVLGPLNGDDYSQIDYPQPN